MAYISGTGPNSRTTLVEIKAGSRSWQVDAATTYHSEIKGLQNKLVTHGYSTGGVDGIYGNATKNAVIAIQRLWGLVADGYYGKGTNAQLTSRWGAIVDAGPNDGGGPTPSVTRYGQLSKSAVIIRNAANGSLEIGRWSTPARFMVYETKSAGGYSWYRTKLDGKEAWIRTDMVTLLSSYFTDYNYRMANIAQSFVGHKGAGDQSAWQFTGDWCQAFCNAMWKQTGTLSTTDRISNSSNCGTSGRWFKTNGQWHSTPSVGDFIYYRWSKHLGTDIEYSHVGLVVSVSPSKSTVNTIEGNRHGVNSVQALTINYNNASEYVIGFGRPKFS